MHACVQKTSGGHKGQAHMNKGLAPTTRGSRSKQGDPSERRTRFFSLSLLLFQASGILSLAHGQKVEPLSLYLLAKVGPNEVTLLSLALKALGTAFHLTNPMITSPPSWMNLIGYSSYDLRAYDCRNGPSYDTP